MARRTIRNYVFNAVAKTVTFTDFATISLESILLITNVTGTRNTIIYQLTDPLKGGTVAGNVLTLASNTTGQTDADKLNIVFEDFNISGGFVSAVNSSAVNLALNAVFTGTGEDVTAYSNIKVNVFSSHPSAVDGLQIQQSSNGSDWDMSDVYSIPANTNKSFSVAVNLKSFRIVYANGAIATTSFRLQVILSTQDKQPSSVRPQDGRPNDNDHVEVLSSLMGYNSTANAWNRVGIASGNLGGNETFLDRLKVTASLRMLDTSQPVGSQLVGAIVTQALGLLANVADRAGRLLGQVTNAGTFAVQSAATLAAETTKIIGTVNIAAAQTLATVSAVTAITNALPSGANAIGNINELRASNLAVTVTAASGVAATLTLPAVAGQFHYVTSLKIVLYSAAARTGAAAPTVVTTTNLSGAIAFMFSTAGAIGTTDIQDLLSATPLKSTTVNTPTTVVAPVVAGGIWRITATYFTGA